MSDGEDYGFEYSDDDQEEEDVNIENQYYNSKGLLSDGDSREAIDGFKEVVKMEDDKGEWGFKAHKQMVKLHFKNKDYKEMMVVYKSMLSYIKSAVTRNYSEKVINKILDLVSGSQTMELLQEFYETTLKALQEAKNDRLWFKTNLKLGKLWFDLEEFGRLQKIVRELHRSCQLDDGLDDPKKGGEQLQLYALEIQMYISTKNTKKLKSLYQKALLIKSAIPHPKTMGVIRECGGKMHMHQREWEKARNDFFEAFKNYDEAGDKRRVNMLKYLVMSTMLTNSDINPFDSQEAKPYKEHPEIIAMNNLVAAYMGNRIREFEKIIKTNTEAILGDAFIKLYIDDLLKNIRTQVLLKVIKPYTRIRIGFIATELNIPAAEVEPLLVTLILDGHVDGHVDQLARLLLLNTEPGSAKKYDAIDKWSTQLGALQQTVFSKLN